MDYKLGCITEWQKFYGRPLKIGDILIAKDALDKDFTGLIEISLIGLGTVRGYLITQTKALKAGYPTRLYNYDELFPIDYPLK